MRLTIGRILAVTGALAATAVIAWSVMPRPIPVETALVTKGRFVATVDEDGKTRIRERYVVAAPLGGRLTRVRLKVGDPVSHVGLLGRAQFHVIGAPRRHMSLQRCRLF